MFEGIIPCCTVCACSAKLSELTVHVQVQVQVPGVPRDMYALAVAILLFSLLCTALHALCLFVVLVQPWRTLITAGNVLTPCIHSS